MLIIVKHSLLAAGVVDFFIFNKVASAEVDHFLRDNLNGFNFFLLKIFKFTIKYKIVNKKQANQPPRPGGEICQIKMIYSPDHPSLKRRGKLSWSNFQKTSVNIAPSPRAETHVIVPLCNLIICLDRLSPMPDPDSFVVKNGMKILSITS
jgi:hypothetical protein